MSADRRGGNDDMGTDNFIRGILWGAVLAICGASLVFSLQMNYGDLYDISPNILSALIETAVMALFTCFWWFLTVNDSENNLLSTIYGSIGSHGLFFSAVFSLIAYLIGLALFMLCPAIYTKDHYSSFSPPISLIMPSVFTMLMFAIPPVQISHWSRRSSNVMTMLLILLRIVIVAGMAGLAAWLFWYSF